MKPLAIIPARAGSEGIVNKNVRKLAGMSPLQRAIRVCQEIGADIWVTTDYPPPYDEQWDGLDRLITRPPHLCTNDASMTDVVKHTLTYDLTTVRPILLVQPTQPLRTAVHLRAALALLTLPATDSVVSVTQIPLTHHPDWQMGIDPEGRLYRLRAPGFMFQAARQSLKPTFIRDGTVYAFWKTTLTHYDSIYGRLVRPLVIPSHQSCPLDTPADWWEAERRFGLLETTTIHS